MFVFKVYYLCEDVSIIGSMFYIMDYVEGDIFWNSVLFEIVFFVICGVMYDEMNWVFVVFYSVDIESVGLCDYGRFGSYFEC